MSDELLTTTALPAGIGHNNPPPDPDPVTIRLALIGDRLTIAQLAAAFDVTERAIYSLIDRYRIPFIRVFNERLLKPDDVRHALLGETPLPPPRPRGRPRKSAAA